MSDVEFMAESGGGGGVDGGVRRPGRAGQPVGARERAENRGYTPGVGHGLGGGRSLSQGCPETGKEDILSLLELLTV